MEEKSFTKEDDTCYFIGEFLPQDKICLALRKHCVYETWSPCQMTNCSRNVLHLLSLLLFIWNTSLRTNWPQQEQKVFKQFSWFKYLYTDPNPNSVGKKCCSRSYIGQLKVYIFITCLLSTPLCRHFLKMDINFSVNVFYYIFPLKFVLPDGWSESLI